MNNEIEKLKFAIEQLKQVEADILNICNCYWRSFSKTGDDYMLYEDLQSCLNEYIGEKIKIFDNAITKQQERVKRSKMYLKAELPICKGKIIEVNNNLTHSETKCLVLLEQLNGDLINVIMKDIQKHIDLYDFCLGKKISTIFNHEMDAYQKVMDYLKENFPDIKKYANGE